MNRSLRRIPLAVGLVTVALAPVVGGRVSADPPNVVIDPFTTVFAIPASDDAPFVWYESASSIGGEVEVRPLHSVGVTIGGGRLSVDAINGSANGNPPTASLVWDGPDQSASIDRDGLGGIDLTANGTKDAFMFRVSTGPDLTPFYANQVQIRAGVSGGSAVVGALLPPALVDQLFVLPFAEIADEQMYTHTGYLEAILSDSSADAMLTIGPLETLALGRAELGVELVVDADSDGRPSPGDTIEYTTTISNLAEYLPDWHAITLSDAELAFATDELAGTLVPGSVQTTLGTVPVGNSPGDTGVQVALGDLDPSEPAVVRFRVIATEAGALANQGALTYTTSNNSTLTTTTDTDDPTTETYFDPTTIEIYRSATVSIGDPDPVNEDDETVTFTVALSESRTQPVTVTATTHDGPATAGSDYVARSDTLTFAPGETSVEFVVDLIDDDEVEDDETFTVTLSDVSGAVLGTFEATATIVDTDVPPSTTPPSTVAPTTDPPATDPTTTAPSPATTTAPSIAPPPSSTTTVPLAPQLPETGSNNRTLIASSTVLLAAGAALLAVTRRRTTPRGTP